MCDLLDDNNFFIFDDENVRISHVSTMPLRKKPHDSMNIVQICLWIINSGCSKNMTGLPKMKFEKDHLCSACKQGKIHQKHHKSKMAFASNKPLYLLHMDLCGPMYVQSINRKQYVLVVVDDYSWYTWIVQICLWIINSGCSKHMTGNRALLTNSVENFLETVRFGNNDFAVIDGYGDVVIGSVTTKKVYYVKGLGHNLFRVG
nr:integrase, catalytic region, zinc finger, CCHC-type, peptidase aspartic, catalytic [Tanacetum cinerariifolium]